MQAVVAAVDPAAVLRVEALAEEHQVPHQVVDLVPQRTPEAVAAVDLMGLIMVEMVALE